MAKMTNAQLQSEVTKLTKQATLDSVKLKELESENIKLKKSLDTDHTVKDLQSTIATLNSQIENGGTVVSSLESDIANLQSELSNASESISALRQSAELFKSKYDELAKSQESNAIVPKTSVMVNAH